MSGDLLLTTDTGKRYVIEIAASGNENEIQEHVQTMDTHARSVEATEAWLVHFDVAETPNARESVSDQLCAGIDAAVSPFTTGMDGPSGGYTAHAMHVIHDLAFRTCLVRIETAGSSVREDPKQFPLG